MSISSFANFQLPQNNLDHLKGGLPDGWTKTTLPNGDIRYDGPNGSYLIVHK